MAYPAALSRYASLVVEGKTYNNLDKLWSAAAPDKELVKQLEKATCKGAIDFALVQKLANVHAKMRKAGNNRGGRAQQPATHAAKTARRSGPPGVPNLADMTMADDQLFGTDGVGPSEEIDVEDVTEQSVGHSIAAVGPGTRALQKFLDTQKFDGVFTLVCKLAAFQDALPATKASYRSRYDPTEGKILFADKGGNLHEVQVILFHFGDKHTDIRSCDEDVTVQMPNEAANYVQVSVQMPNIAATADFLTKGKTVFAKNATLAAGVSNLYDADKGPLLTRTHTKVTFQRESIDIHEGKIIVQRDKYYEVLRRCGLQGIIFRPWGRDNEFGALPLHPKTTLEEARAAATKMGALAYGYILTTRGFSIRIKKSEEIQAKQEFNPELAQAMGGDLMRLHKREGHLYKVCGIPYHLTDVQLVHALTAPTPDGPWTAKPLYKVAGAPFGFKNIVVQASAPAPARVVRFRLGSEVVPLHLVPQQQEYKTLSSVDKVIAQEQRMGGNKSVALQQKTIPQKRAGWNIENAVVSSKPGVSWDDMTTDEQNSEVDDEGYPVDPVMDTGTTPAWPRIPVSRAPRPTPIHLPTSEVDDRFAALELQRESMAQDTQKLVDDAKLREQKFKTQTDRMFDQLTDLQTLIKDNQHANDARMKLIEERSNINEKLANKRFSELMAAVTGNKPALTVDTSHSTNDDDESKSDGEADKPHDTGDRAKRSPRRGAPSSGDVRLKA